ncbi:MAG: DEAD/DEAH box helicase [Promethearchaeia archaeon]
MSKVSKSEQFISHPLIKDEVIKRREYQENIFINCLNKNSLVVIPTGLGKTIIALMLAVYRLSDEEESTVIFLAPTKPLVNQHFESFKNLTNIPEEELQSVTGDIPPENREEIWGNTTVAFMTPQVLQNDIIAGQYSIEDVSLIIFDECHRAVGDYSYCFIAKKYIDIANTPQILGLTASPGSSKEKIQEIKQNLYINHIEIRTEKDRDVKPYVHKVDNEWIKIDLPKRFQQIKNILEKKLKNIYKHLKKKELLNSYDISKINRRDLLKLNKKINNRIANARNNDEKYEMFYAKKLAANALRLSHMTELIETQGINALKDYLAKNEKKILKNKANKSLKELMSDPEIKNMKNLTYKLQSEGLIHPKIEKLDQIIHRQLDENKDSRILVFCHYRDSVNNIVKNFQDDDVIKVHKFVGQANRGSDKGLSQKRQIEILEDFKAGKYNTLIGTSVAEEGLDIAECDLVVFYDVVPSAVRSIQRRGRTGRNKEGKVYILMAKGTRDEGYYWAEKHKEKQMKENLKKLKKDEIDNDSAQSDIMRFVGKESKKEKKSKSKSSQDEENNDALMKNIEQIEGAEEYTVICDNRETSGSVVRALSIMGVFLELEQLKVGDYVISNRVGIERKGAQDFNDSLMDGRLFEELINLKKEFERAILILEGNPFKNTNINHNSLYGAISSIILNMGITVYKTVNSRETAMFIYQLAKKEQTKSKTNINLRFEKAPIENSHLLEYIVSGIPGINSSRAKSLLKSMRTLQTVFNSDIGNLMEIDGIGRKIAQEIYKLSRYKYDDEKT